MNEDAKQPPKRQGRAADLLVSQLEAKILSGEIKDQSVLPAERELMEQFGMSRTVIREAVAILASRGLVEARPRHRPVVRKPGYDTAIDVIGSIVRHLLSEKDGIRNLFEMRIMIEASLVRHAALNANKQHIQALREALEANQAAIPNSSQFYATDVAFHAVLYDIPGNPVLPAVHKAYTDWLAGHWKQMERSAERNNDNFAAHQAIFEAILNRDPDDAESKLRQHLDSAWGYVKTTFSDLS